MGAADLRLSLANVTPTVFRPHIGTNFESRTAEGVPLRLILEKITERPVQSRIAQFSLIFRGPAEIAASHGSYLMQHRTLGSLELFIVPIGASDKHRTYQACFSRHVELGRT